MFPIASNGRVSVVLNTGGGASAGSTWSGGAAISAAGSLQVDTAAVAASDVFHGGLRMKPAGIVRLSTSDSVVYHVGGLPLTSSGQLCVVNDGTPAFHSNGVPISSSGRVCVTGLGAGLTWYLTNDSVSLGSDLSLTDPGAEAYRTGAVTGTGWVVSTGATNHSSYFNDVERGSGTFIGTTQPDGSLDTTNGDFWVSPTALTGNFAAGNWNVHCAVRAQTAGSTHDGRMRCRLFRGANQDGTSATEITAAQQQGSLITDLLTSATQVSTATFDPGAFSVTNEYIFIQLAWERTGAGGTASDDVNVRIGNASGSGSRVVTATFS